MLKTTSAIQPTPVELGYSMPAEWEQHEATWLGWPHNESDWPHKLDTIRWVYGEMVRKISTGELVRILVRSWAEAKLAAATPTPIEKTWCIAPVDAAACPCGSETHGRAWRIYQRGSGAVAAEVYECAWGRGAKAMAIHMAAGLNTA